MDLQCNIGEIVLEHPIMNGAGECKLPEHVEDLARSATSAIVVGSITKEPREGNKGNVFYSKDHFSLNSLGIPNRGLAYYDKVLGSMVRTAHDAGKPLIVNVAGFSPAEYVELAEAVADGGADAVELNFGCPNLWIDGEQKPIFAFDPDLVRHIILEVRKQIPAGVGIFVKISPYSDPMLRLEVAEILDDTPGIDAVVALNTFPNAFAWNDEDKPAIDPAGGFGGMSGPAMQPIALAHVKQFSAIFGDQPAVIGVGGISSGSDALGYLNAGAEAVQIATHYFRNGSRVFSEILAELVNLIEAGEENGDTMMHDGDVGAAVLK